MVSSFGGLKRRSGLKPKNSQLAGASVSQRSRFAARTRNEKFEEYDLAKNVAYSCDDTYSLVSLVSAGLGIGFAPEWTTDIPNRSFVLKKVRGIDFKIGLGIAWSKEDPTASRDDIVEIAKSMVRRG